MSLHDRYRPQGFSSFVGNAAVVASLRDVIARGDQRAFLFTGDPGCGKTTLARIVAKKFGCDMPEEKDCASFNSAEDFRELVARLKFAPISGGNHVVILDEAHAASKAAWSVLLKSLEEPGDRAVWVLCTSEASKVPAAIKTRCVHFELSTLRRDGIKALLSYVVKTEGSHGVAPPADFVLPLVVEASNGVPRRALTLLEKVWTVAKEQDVRDLLAAGEAEDSSPVFELARTITNGASWAGVAQLVRTIADAEIPPETVRYQVQAYLAKVALNARTVPPPHVVAALQSFSVPFATTGYAYASLIVALTRSVKS